jgi:CysZ protein
MFASLGRALGNFFDGTLKGVVLKSVGLTLLLFVVLFAGVELGLQHLPTLGAPWVNRILEILTPVLLILLVFFLGAPVAAIFASLFLDQVAKAVEGRAYPAPLPREAPASFWSSAGAGVRLAGLILLVNLALLPLDVELPGAAEIVTVLANGWLLGREYFELAALRHMTRASAEALRSRHGGSVFAAGTLISLLTLIPIVNLFAPLFGAAFMVHMFRRYAQQEPAA